MEIKASDVKKYVECDESSDEQDFFNSKNNFIKHMSKEKNMTIKEYNDKYITSIGECCALDKIGFISFDKNEVPYQVCNYIDYLEQECKNKKEEVRELAYKIKFNEKSRIKMQQSLMKQINDLEHQVKKQKEVIDKVKKHCEIEINASNHYLQNHSSQQELCHKVAHQRILGILKEVSE